MVLLHAKSQKAHLKSTLKNSLLNREATELWSVTGNHSLDFSLSFFGLAPSSDNTPSPFQKKGAHEFHVPFLYNRREIKALEYRVIDPD